jgi:hypothetical protein
MLLLERRERDAELRFLPAVPRRDFVLRLMGDGGKK